MSIKPEDLKIIHRAAEIKGAASNHRAAIARGLLAMHAAGGGAGVDGNTLEVRVAGLESSRSASGAMDKRLARIEAELGLTDDDPEEKSPAAKKRTK